MDIERTDNPRKARVRFDSLEERVYFGDASPAFRSKEWWERQNYMTWGLTSLGMVRPYSSTQFPQYTDVKLRTLALTGANLVTTWGWRDEDHQMARQIGEHFVELSQERSMPEAVEGAREPIQ
jgi:hypothetical protein